MTNPIEALKSADPGRSVGSPPNQFEIREKIIVNAVTGNVSGRGTRGWGRLIPAAAIGATFALGCGLIVTSALGGDGLPTISLVGGGGGLAATSEAGKSSDAMWMANYVFTLDDGVDIAAGKGDVWRWARPGRADVETLAKKLKVSGKIRRDAADIGGGWSVAAENADYPDAVQLSVALNGSWYWWNSTASSTVSIEECAVPSDGAATKECEYREPEPAKNLPSDADARAKAAPLLSLGGDYKITDIYRDKWSVFVTATYLLPDGTPTNLWGGIGFGDGGVMTNASGQLGTLETVGAYPTISARDAVPRLSSGMLYGYARSGIAVDDVAVDDVLVGEPGADSSGGSGTSGSDAGSGTIEPAPVPPVSPPVVDEPPIEIPQITVRLTKVTMTYTTLWGADNYIWVLPTYEYTDSDGGTWNAVAIVDRYLEGGPLDDTTTTVEPPATTMPSETTVPDEATTTTAASVDPTDATTTTAATPSG